MKFLKRIIQTVKDRASIAENKRLWQAQLEREWEDASRRHKQALARHAAAVDDFHAHPNEENRQETWRCYEQTWGPFNEVFRIWRQMKDLN